MMLNGVPFLLIATTQSGFDKQIKCEIEEKYPNKCHTLGYTEYDDTFLLTVMQYDAMEQKMNEQVDLTASALVIGDRIVSLIRYSEDSIMLCGLEFKIALIFSLPSMQKTKSVSINTEV